MTPLMRQYDDIKKQFPDELVLFQVGDFYELFYDDAKRAAAFLGITLTKRGFAQGQPIPLCGVPRHTVDHYLMKLVRGGFRVVLCDQLSQPEVGKVVERGVTQVLSPGMLTDSKLLDEKSAAYIAIVTKGPQSWGLLFVEILTSSCVATIITPANEKLLEAELSRFLPQEIVISTDAPALQRLISSFGYVTINAPAAEYQAEYVQWLSFLDAQQQTIITRSEVLTQATQILHAYLSKNNATALTTVTAIELYIPDDFLILDSATQRNLEIIKNNYDGSAAHTLFSVLDHATTSMGSRTIKKWLLRPLIDRIALEKRLSYVEALVEDTAVREKLIQHLQSVGDIERSIGRITLKRALLADYLQLARCIQTIPLIISTVQNCALQQLCIFFHTTVRTVSFTL